MLRSLGLILGALGWEALSPTSVFCNNSHLLNWSISPGLPENLEPLNWRKELPYEGLFCHQIQDAVTAGPEEMDSPLPEQELGGMGGGCS